MSATFKNTGGNTHYHLIPAVRNGALIGGIKAITVEEKYNVVIAGATFTVSDAEAPHFRKSGDGKFTEQ